MKRLDAHLPLLSYNMTAYPEKGAGEHLRIKARIETTDRYVGLPNRKIFLSDGTPNPVDVGWISTATQRTSSMQEYFDDAFHALEWLEKQDKLIQSSYSMHCDIEVVRKTHLYENGQFSVDLWELSETEAGEEDTQTERDIIPLDGLAERSMELFKKLEGDQVVLKKGNSHSLWDKNVAENRYEFVHDIEDTGDI